ncbi:unnamed protein product, partial [Dicrocoelium dendriticum]
MWKLDSVSWDVEATRSRSSSHCINCGGWDTYCACLSSVTPVVRCLHLLDRAGRDGLVDSLQHGEA